MRRIIWIIIIIPIVIGIIWGIYIAFGKNFGNSEEKQKIENVFGKSQVNSAKITKFYTYGTGLNIEGKIDGIKKDNYEGIRLIITDGVKFNKDYKADISFDNNGLNFKLIENINLEELECQKYYIQVRLKTNNSKDYRYYLLENISDYKDIEYYTLTKDGTNKKIDIKFEKQNYNNKEYNYLELNVKNEKLPGDVYDFVIDAGHGGRDKGEKYNSYTEADLMLDYAEGLKNAFEEKGYKVKLTRDRENSDTIPSDEYSDNGRICIACKTKAKYMLSLHLNGTSSNSGVEVFASGIDDLSLAKNIADNIYNSTNIEYSTYSNYKKLDGVYVQNFNSRTIADSKANAESKGFAPYNLNTNTSRLFAIREVGGIATNAYMDGRDTRYSANPYYNSNQRN